MAYLAFYRTFRPQTFDQVVRQEHIVRILKNQIETNKVGHAYLFCGPRGTGKTTLAKIFAKAINCEHPVNGSPCGTCPTCRALSDASNLDISEIDAASNNGVDEMRDLREKVQYPPVAGRYKVYIIDEVHMLTPSAFNAVLKTLEEPPAHAVFILATTEPQKIPATILSRCMRFDFKLIPQADLEELVRSVYDRTGKSYEPEAITAIARAGAGSARDSLSIADMCASYSQGKLTYEDVNAVLGSADLLQIADILSCIFAEDAGGSLAAVEQVLAEGKSASVLVRDIISLLNNVSIAKVCRNARDIINLPEESFLRIQDLAENTTGQKLLRVTEVISKAENDMRYAVSPKTTLETAVYKTAQPSADYDTEGLIARIESLERRLKDLESGAVKMPSAPARTASPSRPSRPAQPNAQEQTPAPEPKPAPAAKAAPAAPKTAPAPAPVRAAEPAPKPAPAAKAPAAKPAEEKPAETPKRRTLLVEEDAAEDEPFGVQGNLWDRPAEEPKKEPPKEQADSIDRKAVFGKMLKSLRSTHRNALLFTLCQDLGYSWEGNKYILATDNPAVYKGLTRQDNTTFLSGVLAELGVMDFEIRMSDGSEDARDAAVKELEDNFAGADIEYKNR